jgi:peptidoglycan/LPS O-acetylase OafA/YrhL
MHVIFDSAFVFLLNQMMQKHKYFYEIDTLRAIAVLAVIINHIDKSWLTGGFLGVDMFFVISGFVVTASLQNKNTQPFKSFITSFYKKRFKRLYPGLIGCLFIFSIFTFLFFGVNDVYIKTAFNALFGISNIYLAFQEADYFSISSESNPFTHTWSLGVEEQFYLLFPILFYFIRSKNKLVASLVVLSILSFLAFYLTAAKNSMWAFYLMPGRFWQFALGSIIFTIPQLNFKKNLPKDLIILPLVILFTTLATVEAFSMLSAVIISFATAFSLFIIKETPERRYMGLKPLLKIGLYSYSLYLYHWPIMVFFKQTISLENMNLLYASALILLLSFLSYKYIEFYFRSNQWKFQEKALFFSVFILALTFKFETPKYSKWLYLGSPKEAYSYYDNPKYDEKLLKKCTVRSGSDYMPISYDDFKDTYLKKCQVIKGHSKSIFAFGNSHAQEKAPLFIDFAKNHSYNLFYFTKSGLYIYPEKILDSGDGEFSKKITQFFFDAIDEAAQPGDIIMLSIALKNFDRANTFYQGDHLIMGDKAFEIFQNFLAQKTEYFKKKGVTLIFTDGYPVLDDDIIPVNCYQAWSHKSPNCNINKAIDTKLSQKIETFDEKLENDPRLNYISFYDEIEELMETEKLPMRLFEDEDHLTYYANTLLYPYFEKEVFEDLSSY